MSKLRQPHKNYFVDFSPISVVFFNENKKLPQQSLKPLLPPCRKFHKVSLISKRKSNYNKLKGINHVY